MKKYSSNEFNFKSKDSVINELLSITCEIYQSVNYGLKVGAFVCLDKFTDFKDFWHKGLDYIYIIHIYTCIYIYIQQYI